MPDLKSRADFMKEAVIMSQKNWGLTCPNPSVGTVIVKKGQIITQSVTAPGGRPHSEIIALKKAGSRAAGSDLYVTLEPCSHVSSTPACASMIVESGIRRVFAAIKDPNPLVNGRGLRILRKSGVEVHTGLMRQEAAEANEWFFKQFYSDLPWVWIKSSISLDGRIATRTGDSQWISCSETLIYSHELRSHTDAILTGTSTVLKDNPRFTVRKSVEGHSPHRIVLDRRKIIPAASRVFASQKGVQVYYFFSGDARKDLPSGVSMLRGRTVKGKFDLKNILLQMREHGVYSVLVEGGGELNASLVENGLADRITAVISPRIIGGRKAIPFIGGIGPGRLADSVQLLDHSIRKIGSDYVINGYVRRYF